MSYQAQWALSTASLASPNLTRLLEAPPHEIDAAPLDYLFIELIHSLQQSSSVAHGRRKRLNQEIQQAGLNLGSASKQSGQNGVEETPEQQLALRLERVGIHVGSSLTERLLKDKNRFSDPLDTIKFVCKDVWMACWGKQVDNLRTNHRGVYIIQDNSFRPIRKLSSWDGPEDTLKQAKLHVHFTLGLLRGVLQRLNLNGTVTVDLTHPPQCGFQIKLAKS